MYEHGMISHIITQDSILIPVTVIANWPENMDIKMSLAEVYESMNEPRRGKTSGEIHKVQIS